MLVQAIVVEQERGFFHIHLLEDVDGRCLVLVAELLVDDLGRGLRDVGPGAMQLSNLALDVVDELGIVGLSEAGGEAKHCHLHLVKWGLLQCKSQLALLFDRFHDV